MSPAPIIVQISDSRRDAARIIEEAVASGRPVWVTRHGRASVVLLPCAEHERLVSRIESLEAAAAGETAPWTEAQAAREAPESGAPGAVAHVQEPLAEALVPTRFGLTDPETAAFLAAEGFGVDAPPDAPS